MSQQEELKAIKNRFEHSLFILGRQNGKLQLQNDINWLIEQSEEYSAFRQSVYSIIQSEHLDENEHPYGKALKQIENLIIDSWVKEGD